jgi:two-component system chemotaxis response regulator CheY
MRVLVVDDNDVVRRVLSGIIHQDDRLRLIGEATNGIAALEAIRKEHPHVVCLDAMMPGLDGLEVLKQLKEDAPDTKVVMITGYATADLIAAARQSGAVGFVIKPFNAAKVLAAIHSAAATITP